MVFQDLQQQINQKDEEMRVLDSAKREKEVQLNQLNKQKVRLNLFIQPLLDCNQKFVYSNGCFFCLQSVGQLLLSFIAVITVRKRSCGKVIFSQACIKNCPQGEGVADTPFLGQTSPG